MKTIRGHWRLFANLILLSAVLITSFQNCGRIEASPGKSKIPTGVEIVLEP